MKALEVVPPPVLGLGVVDAGCLVGLELKPVTVEVMSRRGPAHFQMAGLAEAAVREARVRVGSALGGLGITLDEFALTVSLAPADLRKSGSGLDLAIALGALIAVGRAEALPKSTLVLGELSLDGSVRPITGIMPLLDGAKRAGYCAALIPTGNAKEASYVSGIDVRPVDHVRSLVEHCNGARALSQLERGPWPETPRSGVDLADVSGQLAAKRALVIAAAGTHNLLRTGPPGSGKSMLARRLPGILPALSESEALTTTSIHSISGLVDPTLGVVSCPPFRAPHHSVSDAGLVGGGSTIRPGEVSLAHHGVLFLDELPEFRRSALEALRQPLEDGVVVLARAHSRVTFPARPLLVAAMNPCPCGHFGNPRMVCRCSETERARYLSRLSGPLLDRIDLKVGVPPLESADIRATEPSTSTLSSPAARAQIQNARDIQAERQRRGETNAAYNSELDGDVLRRIAGLTGSAQSLLTLAIDKLGLSARGYVRSLRVARTLADLEGKTAVSETHVAEAIGYRALESGRHGS